MEVVTDELKQQAVVISETFPAKVDVYYVFVDRVLEDVVCWKIYKTWLASNAKYINFSCHQVADYIHNLFGIAMAKDTRLYLHTMTVVLEAVLNLIQTLTADDFAQAIDKERGYNLLYKLFIPYLDDYLYEENSYVKKTCEQLIDEWVGYLWRSIARYIGIANNP